MRLALTDPLTGLGNHRHFQERSSASSRRLRRTAAPSRSACSTSTTSSRSTTATATSRRSGARPGRGSPAPGRRGVPARRRRVRGAAARARRDGGARRSRTPSSSASAKPTRPVGEISVSAGVAGFPQHCARTRDSLIRLADRALYCREGARERTRSGSARPDRGRSARARARHARRPIQPTHGSAPSRRWRAPSTRATRTPAATPSACRALAVRIGEQLAMPHERGRARRLAGRLHDLGKLAVPRGDPLQGRPAVGARAPGDRAPHRDRLRHAQSIGVEPVASWVLHHHERWDGTGYPEQARTARRSRSARGSSPSPTRSTR